MAKIHPETLRTLRERRGLKSQAELAKATQGRNKVGLATIKRIEASGAEYEARADTVQSLARTLEVSVEELAAPPQDRRELGKARVLGYRVLKGLVRAENALSFDMVEHLYGVPADRQIAMAPLLFALMAEGSLAWRREQLAAIDEAAEKLASVARSAGHLSFAYAVSAESGSSVERESIERHDLFGRHAPDDAYHKGYDPNTNNPFVDYLRTFAKRIESDDIQIDLDIFEDLPEYRIGASVIEGITGDNRLAYYAMSRGHAKIKDIPEHHLGEDEEDGRIAWMVSRIPEKEREALREEERNLEALRKKLGIDLSETVDHAPSSEPC